jgi:hypothetical protein
LIYGHLIARTQKKLAERLDKTVFGNSVGKLLANPISEGNPAKKEIPKVIKLQGFKFGSGDRI